MNMILKYPPFNIVKLRRFEKYYQLNVYSKLRTIVPWGQTNTINLLRCMTSSWQVDIIATSKEFNPNGCLFINWKLFPGSISFLYFVKGEGKKMNAWRILLFWSGTLFGWLQLICLMFILNCRSKNVHI